MTEPRIAGLYAIADTQYLDDTQLLPAVTEAIAGGTRVIQYRDKIAGSEERYRDVPIAEPRTQFGQRNVATLAPKELAAGRERAQKHIAEKRIQQAKELAALCRQHGVLFIVNDDVELARQVQADGVHLGREDTSVAHARVQLGPRAIIGVSCYNELERALKAQADGADYVAFGSFFPSRTKPKAVRASPELLREAKQKLHVPIVAIGGITPENGAALIAAGADALAVIEGVFGQADVRVAAGRYARLFAEAP